MRTPLNEYRFPRAMALLRPPERAKAIEFANKLMGEGREEAEAVHLAIAEAKRWSERRKRGLAQEYF